MEAFKALVSSQAVRDKHVEHGDQQHKDKLAQTKAREREVKEAAKAEREKSKQQKEEERLAAAATYRLDRAYNHTSKRAAAEERKAEKAEAHKQTGSMCEHGVWRCRICNPITTHK